MAIVSALAAISLLIGTVQDIKENQISDYTWVPAATGAILMIYLSLNNYLFLLLKLSMIITILAVYFLLGGGQADIIGLAVLIVDDDPLAPIGSLIVFVLITLPYAFFKILIKKERRLMIPLNEFMKKKNMYPTKVFVEGKEEKLSKTADKAYEELERLSKENKNVVVEAESGLPAVVPMCAGYFVNMILFYFFGESWVRILVQILSR